MAYGSRCRRRAVLEPIFPGAFRWNLGAHVLPRAHVDVGLDFYLDKIEGSDKAFKTVLAQLHMYL